MANTPGEPRPPRFFTHLGGTALGRGPPSTHPLQFVSPQNQRAVSAHGGGNFSVLLEQDNLLHPHHLLTFPPSDWLQSLEGLKDGDSAHFECTLTPVNDPELKVEWFHNGKPIFHKNRVKMVSDFGFVVMDIAYVQSHDSGEYVCRAWNK